MPNSYPIRFSEQLRQHLKGLRKKHGYTQAKLGELVGVSQARIAEIEANPGLVNLDQLLQVFSALGAALSLEELQDDADVADSGPSAGRAGPPPLRDPDPEPRARRANKSGSKPETDQVPAFRPKKGSW